MNRHRFLKGWSLAAGVMDAVTGLMLVFVPGLVLSLLMIEASSPEAMIYLRWIGVFVLAVGLSYGIALGGCPQRGETVWWFTALVRGCVAVFLMVQIAGGRMAPAWVVVAMSDGAVAAVQLAILRLGWWKEVAQ